MIDINEAKIYLNSFNDDTKLDMYKLHYHLGIHFLIKHPFRKFENEFIYLLDDVLKFRGTYKVMDDIDIIRNCHPKILGVKNDF